MPEHAWDCDCGTRNDRMFTHCRQCGAPPHAALRKPWRPLHDFIDLLWNLIVIIILLCVLNALLFGVSPLQALAQRFVNIDLWSTSGHAQMSDQDRALIHDAAEAVNELGRMDRRRRGLSPY